MFVFAFAKKLTHISLAIVLVPGLSGNTKLISLSDIFHGKRIETLGSHNFANHYFGQFLVRLVVFLSDDELIFLLLFETMICQAYK